MRLTLCLVFLTQSVFTYLTYDQGLDQLVTSKSTPITIQNTITFSNSFQHIPQIIIVPQAFSLLNSKHEIQFEIITVTLTNFQYKITCPFTSYVARYNFHWLAIDEERIQVLNPPKETIVTDGTIYTYQHTFSQVTQAFVILNSIGFLTGELDFQISVFSVSNTNVKIQLSTANTNIQLIGFQIILGTNEAFYTTNIQKTGGGDAVLGQYTVKILQNSLFYCPFIGFSWSGVNNVRISYSSTTILQDYQYTYSTFSGTIMTSVTLQSIQFFTQILFPYYIKKYVVTKQFVEFPNNQIFVNFIELNQSFNSDTLQTFNLPQTQSQLNIQIEILLSPGKKVQGQFLKCNECGNNNKHIINQSYYSQGSFIKFRIQLLQYTNSASTLVFSMSSNKILIQQIINQVVDTYDIISLELINS